MAENAAIQKTESQTVEATEQNQMSPRQGWTYRPSVDLVDAPDEFVIFADMPGASRESIDVNIDQDILTIEANVPPRRPQAARDHRREYGVGDYHRRFELGDAVDVEKISAEYRDGVLAVRLPKSRSAKRRRVPVRA